VTPPAPGLFSITTGCFNSRDSASATGRATVSATPPGGNGTIIVIGLSGYWANAADDAANATAAMAARAKSAATRALELDPDNGEAQATLAGLVPMFGNWATAEEEMRRVLATHPQEIRIRFGRLLAERIEAGMDFRILGWFENGFRHVSNRLRPVRVPADLKGMTIRVLPSKVQARTFELLGAVPKIMDLSEVIPAVKAGTLDAQENPFLNTVTYGVHNFHKFHTASNHFYLSRPIFLHRPTFDSWPRELQDEMRAAVADACRRLGAEGVRHLFARPVHQLARGTALGVDARGIAVRVAKDARHRIRDDRQGLGGDRELGVAPVTQQDQIPFARRRHRSGHVGEIDPRATERVDHPGRHVVNRDIGSRRRAPLRQLLEDQRGVEP